MKSVQVGGGGEAAGRSGRTLVVTNAFVVGINGVVQNAPVAGVGNVAGIATVALAGLAVIKRNAKPAVSVLLHQRSATPKCHISRFCHTILNQVLNPNPLLVLRIPKRKKRLKRTLVITIHHQ